MPKLNIVHSDADTGARIYLDGLLILCFNAKNVCQAGIHTTVDPDLNHRLKIEVSKKQNGQKEFKWALPEDKGQYSNVRQEAPYWLYVDTGVGKPPAEGATERFEPNDSGDERSFAHVLNFQGERLHNKNLGFVSGVLAPINITHGLFYTASSHQANRKVTGASANPEDIGLIADKIAADIKHEGGKRYIVLEQRNPRPVELFRYELEAGVVYEITIQNAPEAHHSTGQPHNHFPEFYKALSLPSGEPRFIVDLVDQGPSLASQPNFPPCDGAEMSRPDGLPEWIP